MTLTSSLRLRSLGNSYRPSTDRPHHRRQQSSTAAASICIHLHPILGPHHTTHIVISHHRLPPGLQPTTTPPQICPTYFLPCPVVSRRVLPCLVLLALPVTSPSSSILSSLPPFCSLSFVPVPFIPLTCPCSKYSSRGMVSHVRADSPFGRAAHGQYIQTARGMFFYCILFFILFPGCSVHHGMAGT